MPPKKRTPRYIDANLAKTALLGWDTDATDEEIERTIDKIPTADVVPKSEAESLTLELNAMRGAANSYKMHYNNLAKEIFEEIEKLFFKNGVFIHIQSYNQLKKKYTEEGEKS
ncbi:MAG: hypothetical protein IKJ91_11775 [Clostridia bacterium]|nr:hypothetical protein [Clostridia bacterium]MBR3967738.1 hypothetical protein [Clostridia bacterium]